MTFYRYPDLKAAGIPWTRKHINHLESLGRFPRRVRLGANTIAWPAREIERFIADRIAARGEREATA